MLQLPNGHVVRALTIAGSDSSGGAGIQADLKTFHQFEVYGMSVITALTAQNTTGVQAIHEIPSDFIRSQITSIDEDLGMDAVKTGMLASAGIINEVADYLGSNHNFPVVVDPVMVAKGGAPLLQLDAMEALKYRLLPLATIVTPNLPEAEVICGYSLTHWEHIHQAAKDIASLGPKIVVIKGGHWSANHAPTEQGTVRVSDAASLSIDTVYISDTETFTYVASDRVDSLKTHGTGCTYSSAITALLAKGNKPLEAISGAKAFVYQAIERARTWDVGHGHGPTDHSTPSAEPYQPELCILNVYRNGRWIVC